MADDPVRGFLGRWSRLKQAATESAPADAAPVVVAAADVAAPQTESEAPLPPVESLDFDSDFRGFLGDKVDEGVKRAALKKLFHTGPFNTMDGLDVYIEDFSVFEPLPASMVAQLMHARETLSPTLPADWFGPVVDPEPTAEVLAPELLPDVPSATNTLPETPDEPEPEPEPEAEAESLPLPHADALSGSSDDPTRADLSESRSRSE
ncbi:DUF3306 domain-containing protein [Methyloversatilis sp.]|uniref:DUF3306 domain-containing protein n=1 Tax=Methyloversatilis sp. TaxID=2569862 RepID=UPI002735DDEF|nr:DUF3306 domain-containing protein [Methyloversatilis sp.]MDP3453865.1 DUF3306 domain-containing protein [Methyloversatilis sp.]MDP3576566.1 DUF3306 domain-containing protein [Methyloversatilis sp.]